MPIVEDSDPNDFNLPEKIFGRLDERVKILVEQQKEIDIQIEKTLNLLHNALNRLVALEAKDFNVVRKDLYSLKKEIIEIRNKVQNFEIKSENIQMRIGYHDHRWTQIFDSLWKVALMCIAGYILYKLGLQSPPN